MQRYEKLDYQEECVNHVSDFVESDNKKQTSVFEFKTINHSFNPSNTHAIDTTKYMRLLIRVLLKIFKFVGLATFNKNSNVMLNTRVSNGIIIRKREMDDSWQ